jgi:NTE family protein
MYKEPKIGLALGGGGARGIAHIGVLKVLEKEGIKIDFITGTSMGSLIGACYALGLSLEDLEKEALSFNKRKALSHLFDFGNPKISLLGGSKIHKYINHYLKDADFEDTKIPFQAIATDLSTGNEVILKNGDMSKAVIASISVPGIFPPVKIDDRYLIDGGIVNCTPVGLVEKMGADIIIGVDFMLKGEIEIKKQPSIFETLMQSYEIIRSNGTLANIEKVDKDLVLIQPHLRASFDSFKFYDINKFIESGEKATIKIMPELKEKVEKFEK